MSSTLPFLGELNGLSLPLQIVSVIGILYVASTLRFFGRLLWTYVKPNPNWGKYKGTWAIVTGSSYGIGSSFAKQLASHRINLVLMARSKDKLEEVAKEIESSYRVHTMVIPFDFATKDSTQYDSLKPQFDKIDVSILVNNVGVLTADVKFFLDHSADEIDWMSHINISSVNHMTRIILPHLIQRKQGLVLNVASISAIQHFNPLHYFAVYGATKAYVIRLTQLLDAEYREKGVEFLAITPGIVTSHMSQLKKRTPLVLTEEELTTAALHKVGQHLVVVQPHWRHLMQHILWQFPSWLVMRILNFFKNKLDSQKQG